MDSPHSERRQVRVTIFNQTYTLRTTGEEGETEQLAHSVDELMNDIASRTGAFDSGRVGVLACLHLADQLRSLQRDLDELRQRVADKSRNFSKLLDEVIRPD
ncbi:MAG: cell division protein ZapA [Bryobacteraceae bacterium]|nr:cell division protein ZapA [Bryobacteraceae bacterium]